MKSNPWIRFGGIAGLVLLAFGIFGGAVIGFDVALSNPLILAHFLLGVVGVGAWFVTAGSENISAAGGAVTGRAAQYGYLTASSVLLIVGLLAGGNFLVTKYNKRWDLTEEGVYSLSPQSQGIIKSLSKPTKLVALIKLGNDRGGESDKELQDRLDLYRYYNPGKLSVETVDPSAKPHLIEKYGFKAGNRLYVSYGEGESEGVARINEASEEAITNAIIKLQRGDAKKVYYVVGHNEPNIRSVNQDGLKKLADAIGDEHLTIEEVLLATLGEVPSDAAAVILASPKKPMTAPERDLLIKYAENGGRLVLLGDPRTTDDVRLLAEHFGIAVGDNVVIDQVQRLFAGPALGAQPVVRTYAVHPITRDFTQNSVTKFNIASTVTAKGKTEGDVTYTDLLKSGPSAWGETDIKSLFDESNPYAGLDEKDIKGPVTLGVLYEKKIAASDKQEAKTTRVVVIGDTDWVLNVNLDVFSNRDLALNVISWTAGQEAGLSIRPSSIKASLAPIGESDFLKILAASFLIPELLLLTGLIVWWRRRTSFA